MSCFERLIRCTWWIFHLPLLSQSMSLFDPFDSESLDFSILSRLLQKWVGWGALFDLLWKLSCLLQLSEFVPDGTPCTKAGSAAKVHITLICDTVWNVFNFNYFNFSLIRIWPYPLCLHARNTQGKEFSIAENLFSESLCGFASFELLIYMLVDCILEYICPNLVKNDEFHTLLLQSLKPALCNECFSEVNLYIPLQIDS